MNRFSKIHTYIFLTLLTIYSCMPVWSQSGTPVAEAEAEEGVLSGVVVSTSKAGYSGSGYVTGFDNDGDQVTVTMNVPDSGFYKLVIRYNGSGGSKYQDVIVNGGYSALVSFPAYPGFTDTDAGSYNLKQGNNTFTVRKNWGWSDVDLFSIYTTEKNTYELVPDPVDPKANTETRALYNFLLSQFGQHILSGQTNQYYDELASLTGKTPVIRAGDMSSYTEGYPYVWKDGGHTFGWYDNGTVDQMIDWYNSTGRKGIVAFQWHWHSPTGGDAGTNTFYTSETSFDIRKAVTPGTQEYDDIIRDIDDIATELKKFRDAGIPVLWRPLHEAGGGWFWWGAHGPEPCKALYNIMYDRLTNYHHLHNLIWVWSTPEADWYPGNDKVDIIGYDSYPGNYNYGPQKYFFDKLYKLTGGKKLIAMTENGPVPDPALCFLSDAPWAFFVSWSDLVTQQNTQEHLDEVFNHPLVFTLESQDLPMYYEWRSSLYPEDWKPGYKDKQGRFLHDFSYAGYHRGEEVIPEISANITDVTKPPYSADNTGNEDVTDIIQQALDDVGSSGGGVVYLPAGTYRIATPDSRDYAWRIKYDSIVLRGAGPDSTFIFHDQDYLRHKNIIEVYDEYAGWHQPYGAESAITVDLDNPTRIIPVTSVAGFNAGDLVVVKSTPTEAFMEEHGMGGIWTENVIRGVHFLRRIDSVDTRNNLLFIDTPTRYYLKTRDNARVYHARKHITECGIENLSIGNRENPKDGWDEESYNIEGTGAYDVHFSHVILFRYGLNCWVKNIHTYKPPVNTGDVHVLSNCLSLEQCRFVTVDSCDFQKPQYEGGGGNGYMYILESNDCLVKNSRGNDGRHNFDFKYPFSNGNVILHCRAEHSKYASDFHMYLSMANLFDACTVDEDYLESVFRPYGGDAIHGYSSTQSVFYNTKGLAYHEGRDFIIDSRQFGMGYVIGTSGPAAHVRLDPVSGTLNGYRFDTSPKDFLEGEGLGEGLTPGSLYLDQLDRRLNGLSNPSTYKVRIIIRDEDSGELIPESKVSIYNDSLITDRYGEVLFPSVYENFILKVEKDLYQPFLPKQIAINSDTVLTYYLKKKVFEVTFRVLDTTTVKPLLGSRISLGDVNEVADINGEATMRVPAGENHYSIEKISFRSESGILDIISDTLITFYLVRTSAVVKIFIKDGEAPVSLATVKVNEDSVITGGLGLAKFSGVPVDRDYHYHISCDDYYDTEGDFHLVTDTSINVQLERMSSGIAPFADMNGSVLWPNPAGEAIFGKINTESTIVRVKVINLRGEELFVTKPDGNPFRLNIKNLPPGIYILQVMTDDAAREVHLFVKKITR